MSSAFRLPRAPDVPAKQPGAVRHCHVFADSDRHSQVVADKSDRDGPEPIGSAQATSAAEARPDAPRSPTRQRQFGPPAPNRLWVADLTYVSTWSGFAHVAFVVDAYARRILGWRVASTMATSMALDAIEQAIWTRQQEGVMDLNDVVYHTDRGSQYTPIRFSDRLGEAGIQPSVGAVGRSYDNALAETINGLYKNRVDQTSQTVADHRGGRVGHRRMGRLVRPPPPLREL